MADIGLTSLLVALALAIYSIIGSILGQIRIVPAFIASARRANYMVLLALLISTTSLIGAFLSNDFQVEYVFAHSSVGMPRLYTWVAFYAGNEGSLLFIATILSMLSAIAVFSSPKRFQISLPYTNATLMLILAFFLTVMITLANPFSKLSHTPMDGQGINPLLLHPGMFFHPPVLMSGLVMVSIPFAFAMGSLLSGRIRDEWVDLGRIWGIIAWATLGIGLLLGSWWAYTILGWGGYWAWDPVENAGLMPWLGLTAFIHSIMVQKRQGMFRMWNIALVNISFGLALFGMFINRGGPVPSVHSFAASTLGWIFLLFMITGVIVPFLVFLWRYKLLISERSLESSLSREAAFLINNLLLLSVAFITLWGGIYPLISELFTGFTVTVGEPFYNQVNGPLLIALVFLMGIGPLLPWRKASIATFKRNLSIPIAVGLTTAVLIGVLGIRKPYALIAFSCMSLVLTGIFAEWIRGTRARWKRGEFPVKAFLTLLASNRPRYGGYIAHLAIVVLAFGIVGSSFYGTEKDVLLSPSESVHIQGYKIKYVGSQVLAKADRVESYFTMDVSKDGKDLGEITAERTLYRNFDISSTRAGIRSTPIEDLYIVPSEVRDDDESIGFRIFVNPLIWWMWVAGPIMIIGTTIALWPSGMPNLGRLKRIWKT